MRIGLKFLKINNGVKKVQNFDGVTDTWLLTFLFSTNCDLGFIVNLMKKKVKAKQNITIMDNLRWPCYNLRLIELIRTVSAEVNLYIGYKSVILTLSLPNGIQQAYIFDPIEEPNIKFYLY